MDPEPQSENKDAEKIETLHDGTLTENISKEANMCDTSAPVAVNDKPAESGQGKNKGTKSRKKDDCNVQHVLRALNSLTTPEEKLAAMCKKYSDLFEENRKLQANLKQFQKQMASVVKEKDQSRTDLAKSVLTRSRLESLCRELQRQNKMIKEESITKIKEEEEKRKEVSAKFQVTLNEITELMKQDNDKTMKLRDDNIDLTTKLKSIHEQYAIREQQMEKMGKQMALESQLYEAKVSKLEMEATAEKEILLREKQQLLMTLTDYQARHQEHQNIETTLRNQITMYNNKYEEFEKSLTRSNKMFGGFKEEMEGMSTKIVKLESETSAWKQRWEKTQKALLEMATEKQKSDQEIVVAAKQMSTLHKLCRALQTERAQLIAKLKENNIPLSSATEDDKSEESTAVAEAKANSAEKDSNCCKKNSETKVNKNDVKAIPKTKSTPAKAAKSQSQPPAVENVTTADSTPSPTPVVTEDKSEPSNITPQDSTAVAPLVTEEKSEISNIASQDCAENVEAPPKEQQSLPLNGESSSSSSAPQKLACDITQLAFPQTDTFSFTYNGNVLNELKCNTPPSEAKDVVAATSAGSESPASKENSQQDEFILKKSTHSSKQKISPKKKHKK